MYKFVPTTIDRSAIISDKLNARKRMERNVMGSREWWAALDALRKAESILG